MKKWILFICGIVVISLSFILFFKIKDNIPVVNPITLNNTTQMKLDPYSFDKMYRDSLPRPKQKSLAIEHPQKQGDTKPSEASIRVEQELLWREDDTTQKDEEDKSSFSRWIKQKLYGVKMKLKLPF